MPRRPRESAPLPHELPLCSRGGGKPPFVSVMAWPSSVMAGLSSVMARLGWAICRGTDGHGARGWRMSLIFTAMLALRAVRKFHRKGTKTQKKQDIPRFVPFWRVTWIFDVPLNLEPDH